MSQSAQNKNRPSDLLNAFLHNENGATAVEYAIIISVLSITVVGGIAVALGAVETLFSDNNSEINIVFNR